MRRIDLRGPAPVPGQEERLARLTRHLMARLEDFGPGGPEEVRGDQDTGVVTARVPGRSAARAAEQLGLPGELLPMALLRPVSGSGALALFEDILTRFGPDSFIGRTASVLMGSTETTFYTIALYFGATKVRNTRHCLPAALLADVAGICLSAAAVGLFLGR